MKNGAFAALVLTFAVSLVACGGPPAPPSAPPGPNGPGPNGPGPGPGPSMGMANPASKNCVDKGGKLEIKSDAQGNESGVCVFKDGSSCDEWAFMNGQCAPGQHK